DDPASAFEQDDITPAAFTVLANAPLDPKLAEPAASMQREAGSVLGEDAGEQGPGPVGLGRADAGREHPRAHTSSTVRRADVDALPLDAAVDAAARPGGGGEPCRDLAVDEPDDPGAWRVTRVELRPRRDGWLQGRITRRDALAV